MLPVWGARFRITRHSETARVRALLAREVAFWEIEGRFLRLTGRQRACPNGPPGEKIPSFVRVSDNPAGELWRSPKQRAGGVGTAALTPMTAVDPIFRERRLAGRIRSATRPASKLPETRKHVACHRILSPVSMLKRRECRCGASKGPASSRGL